VSTNGAIRSQKLRMISSSSEITRSSTVLSELPVRSNSASIRAGTRRRSPCTAEPRWCAGGSARRPHCRYRPAALAGQRAFDEQRVPLPSGRPSTRQWLTRSAIFLPPSLERRMNEFSPVITTSCGSTICGGSHGLAPDLRTTGGMKNGRFRSTTGRANDSTATGDANPWR